MPYEIADNTGSFWCEPKERVSKDGKPYSSYSGSCKIDGKEYWINGLMKTTKNGAKLYDLRFKPKDTMVNVEDIKF